MTMDDDMEPTPTPGETASMQLALAAYDEAKTAYDAAMAAYQADPSQMTAAAAKYAADALKTAADAAAAAAGNGNDRPEAGSRQCSSLRQQCRYGGCGCGCGCEVKQLTMRPSHGSQ